MAQLKKGSECKSCGRRAGGSLSDIETTVAMNAEDARATFEADGTAARSGGDTLLSDLERMLFGPMSTFGT